MMDTGSKHRDILRRYLLGSLSEDELSQVELQILADKEFYDQFQALEEELIDEYLNGELADHDKSKFEASFLSTPEGYEQVELAKNLRLYARNASEGVEPLVDSRSELWWSFVQSLSQSRFLGIRYAMPVFLLFSILIIAWLTTSVLRLQGEINRLRAQQTSQQPDITQLEQELSEMRAKNQELTSDLLLRQGRMTMLEQELADLRPEQKGKKLKETDSNAGRLALVAVTLLPGSTRNSGRLEILNLEAGTRTVLFRLELIQNNYKKYNAILESVEGEVILTVPSLSPQSLRSGKSVNMSIRAEQLAAGDYIIRLSGVTDVNKLEGVGSYYFRALRE